MKGPLCASLAYNEHSGEAQRSQQIAVKHVRGRGTQVMETAGTKDGHEGAEKRQCRTNYRSTLCCSKAMGLS